MKKVFTITPEFSFANIPSVGADFQGGVVERVVIKPDFDLATGEDVFPDVPAVADRLVTVRYPD